ncbi:type II toxin-antitoxin system VapC family toxin [Thiocapsa roseopersicina]|uniref:Predicted nucleic-acid-binding protein, contains PIN domain n=1 Tax=Thiocapsa roseopersicina TaxID=1058 RepID=A0A1H2Q0T5_THIRO|nr:type II toxin-antitoxin system VapC family toxin [Thiocapsa roseopersicina]SDW00119.1 Predicted nucleic-acid-binding protein, contains PIN domain [Thiocapsa roseopersicina]
MSASESAENLAFGEYTNVVVRIVANDDPEQSPRAVALFERERIFLTKTVLLETEWVLRFSYKLSRETVVCALRKVIGLQQVEVETIGVVAKALDWHEQGMDFAEALHLAGSTKAIEFATFDEKLIQLAQRLQAKGIVAV